MEGDRGKVGGGPARRGKKGNYSRVVKTKPNLINTKIMKTLFSILILILQVVM